METSEIVTLISVAIAVGAGVVYLIWILSKWDRKRYGDEGTNTLGDRTALEAKSGLCASRLPISLRRAKGDKSVIHEFVEASRVESDEAFGIGPSQEVATVYPEAALESRLDERSRDGWELFSMEPH